MRKIGIRYWHQLLVIYVDSLCTFWNIVSIECGCSKVHI